MKTKSLLTIAILALSLASCKKDNPEPEQAGNRVVYGIECESCTFIIETDREPNKRIEVTKFFQRAERNNLTTINISTIGTGVIRTFIKVNDTIIFRSEELNQKGQMHYVVNVPII